MSKVKFAAGLLVMVGLPLALALVFAGAAVDYAHQHVHNTWAVLQGSTAVVKHADYTHTAGGIVATCGGFGIAWVLLSTLFVLAGGKMISARNRNWD